MCTMRQRRLLIILSATLLISLPKAGVGQHCNENQWNLTLEEQTRIESWYNRQATRFNHLYSQYKQQVLLHKEFSLDELVSFWRPDAEDFHLTLTQQIELSNQAGDMISKERDALRQGLSDVKDIHARWELFIAHCQSMSLNINALSSTHYANSNLSLLKDIELLEAKLTVLQDLYEREATVLSEAKSIAVEEWKPSNGKQ